MRLDLAVRQDLARIPSLAPKSASQSLIAQLAEQPTVNRQVLGSSPSQGALHVCVTPPDL